MIDLINAWRNVWHHSLATTQKMPLTEKDPGERVSYPYPLKKIRVNHDIDIAYTEVGPQNGQTLVFIHGLASGLPVWRKNIQKLKTKYRCIAIDLPGHGYSSDGSLPYNMNFYADVVLGFLNTLRLSNATLIGHSMGGQIAVIAALKRPDLVRSLVLAAPSGLEPYTVLERQILINLTAGMVASGNVFTHNRINQFLGFCENQKDAGEFISWLTYRKNDAFSLGKIMLRSIEAMLLEGVNGVINKLQCPCLILVGRKDQISPYPLFRGKNFADVLALESTKIPNCKLIIFPQASHFFQYQNPELFNKEVKEFLSEKPIQV
jgi:pimeloyl-ACP methyl ester carboxylesterase